MFSKHIIELYLNQLPGECLEHAVTSPGLQGVHYTPDIIYNALIGTMNNMCSN